MQAPASGAVLPAGPLDLAPGALRVDLEADEELVILRDRRRRADEVEVRLHRERLERHAAAVPRLAEVAADLVAVRRNRSLDPLDPADRAALAREAREHAAPAAWRASCSARSRRPNELTLTASTAVYVRARRSLTTPTASPRSGAASSSSPSAAAGSETTGSGVRRLDGRRPAARREVTDAAARPRR